MAHKDDVYADPQNRFIVGEHTCPEKLTGWYGECVDDWCIEHGHKWYCVSKVLPDESGEIITFRIDGEFTESFLTEADAIEAAEEYFDAMAARHG